MKLITTIFFNDKLRSIMTMFILISILIMCTLSYLFPKRDAVEEQTIESLKKVTIQIKKAAESLEEQSRLTDSANKALTRQLEEMEQNRHERYQELLDKYGIEIPDFTLMHKERNLHNTSSTGGFIY